MELVIDRAIEGDGTTESEWSGWPGLSRLPILSLGSLLPPGARAVVVAPHPDDEVLSVGGMIAQLARHDTPLQVIAVTDGEASHRDSQEWPTSRLLHERPQESRDALSRLGFAHAPLRLGLPDGGLHALHEMLVERLLELLDTTDVVFTTWRDDGHPDHEATGHACALAAARINARLIEVPVWAWHWAAPGDARLPWRRAGRLPLDADAAARKRCAVQAFDSQLRPDATTGAGPILRATTVARASRPYEVMFT